MKKIALPFILVALLYACEEIFEVTDISGQRVAILAPTDQSVVTDSLVRFTWNSVDEATAFKVQIATPNFENASQILMDTLLRIDTTFTGNNLSKRLPNSPYEWRIRAENSDFSTPFTTSTFTVQHGGN